MIPTPRQAKQFQRNQPASEALLQSVENRYGDCSAPPETLASQGCTLLPNFLVISNVRCWNWLTKYGVAHRRYVSHMDKSKYGSRPVFDGAVVTLADAMVIRQITIANLNTRHVNIRKWLNSVARKHAEYTRSSRTNSIAARRVTLAAKEAECCRIETERLDYLTQTGFLPPS